MSLAWLSVSSCVQLLWGCYPVALRYLQNASPHTLTSLQLAFLINLCACPMMLLHTLMPRVWARKVVITGRSSRHKAAVAPKRASRCSDPDSPSQPWLSDDSAQEEASGSLMEDEESQQQQQQQPVSPGPCQARVSPWRKAGLLAATTTSLAALMLSQIFALVFVPAYISQMVFLLAPLLVSSLALALLRTPLPPRFWPTLLLMLAGAGMVVGGKARAAAIDGAGASAGASSGSPLLGLMGLRWAQEPDARLGPLVWRGGSVVSLDEAVGVGLSLLSALCLALFMLALQAARGAISHAEVLWANFPAQAALALALTCALERPSLPVLGRLLAWEWGVVAGVAVGVNWLANLLQQVTIQRLGAPQVAAFLPLRLVGSLAASYIILGEALDNAWEGAGAGLVLATLSWYLCIQKRRAEEAAGRVLQAEAASNGADSL